MKYGIDAMSKNCTYSGCEENHFKCTMVRKGIKSAPIHVTWIRLVNLIVVRVSGSKSLLTFIIIIIIRLFSYFINLLSFYFHLQTYPFNDVYCIIYFNRLYTQIISVFIAGLSL